MDKQKHTHSYLHGLILAGLTLMLLRLVVNDSLTYYLSPTMHPYLYASIIVLGLLSVIQLAAPNANHMSCDDCDHHHMPTKGLPALVFYCLFLFPIISGFTFPDHALGSDVAADRQMRRSASSSLSGNASQSQTGQNGRADRQPISQNQFDRLKHDMLHRQKLTIEPKNYTYMMTIIEQNLDHLKGKEVTLTGFVYRDKQTASSEFIAARFVITCCIADASVYGMPVRGDVGHFNKDRWVEVSGTLNAAIRDGKKVPIVDAKQVTSIPQPKHPYVYDNGVNLNE